MVWETEQLVEFTKPYRSLSTTNCKLGQSERLVLVDIEKWRVEIFECEIDTQAYFMLVAVKALSFTFIQLRGAPNGRPRRHQLADFGPPQTYPLLLLLRFSR
jgi:hypothetical protein